MRRRRGFTLIEILVTIVVIGIAATALLGVFGNIARSSVDPVIRQQAIAIAEAYLEEILLKDFDDPTDPEQGAASTEAGEPTRDLFDDVQDYNHLGTTQVRDQNNVAIPALVDYQVAVTVAGAALNTVPAAASMRIRVDVSHPAIATISLVAYRADY